MVVTVNKLSMVYDADSGWGEVRYLLGKMRGRHCALCDITHSTVKRKADFDDLACNLGMEVDVLHRNEQSPNLAAFTDGIEPVVVAHSSDGMKVLLDRDQLTACDGDVEAFAKATASALESLGASK